MSDQRSVFSIFKRVYAHLSVKRRHQMVLLGIMMIVTSFLEALSIGSMLPFLAALTAPEKIREIELFKPFLTYLGVSDVLGIQLTFTLLFISLIIFSTILRVLFFWLQTRLSMAIGLDFSVNVFERLLNQPYIEIVSKNSSEILAGAQKAKDLAGSFVLPSLTFASSIFTLSVVFGSLLAIEPKVAFIGILGFGGLYCIATIVTKRRLNINSSIYASEMGRVNKAVLEGIGGIRDVIIDGTQIVFSKFYSIALAKMQRAACSNAILSQLPRYIIEATAIILLSAASYLMINSGEDLLLIIPMLGVTAMCAQKLLPVLQQAYAAFVTIKGALDSVLDALDFLDNKPQPQNKSINNNILTFKSSIELKNILFRYPSDPKIILNGINLKINQGERLGIIGATGSGKSTLVDILMGLLKPTSGTIEVDSQILSNDNVKDWHSLISHVPQFIFLADGTITENIAFGAESHNIDMVRVYEAAEAAQLSETIKNLPNSYETFVGERGIRLSGGQRQRLGLARALYKRSNLLILDEATSALDSETEKMVINSIQKFGNEITIILITHRAASLKICSRIVELSKGELII